jgi:cytochrome c oxidase subunit IV
MKETTHPRHANYVLIFVILGVLTAVEVAASQLIAEPVRIPILLLLAGCKGALVALYYMHLQSDSRIFAFFFAAAIFVLAIPFALILLAVQTPLVGPPH